MQIEVWVEWQRLCRQTQSPKSQLNRNNGEQPEQNGGKPKEPPPAKASSISLAVMNRITGGQIAVPLFDLPTSIKCKRAEIPVGTQLIL
jgi:hypothetical protein